MPRPTHALLNALEHWRVQPSFFFWGGGKGATWQRDPSQSTPKTENSTDLGHYFLEEPKFTFDKKCSTYHRPDGPPPLIMENMTDVVIFM